MNNNRLTTPRAEAKNNSNLIIIKDLESKINYLLANSNLEIPDNGKIFIKSSKKYIKGRGNIQIDAFKEEGILFQSFESIKIAALFFNTSLCPRPRPQGERSIFRKLESGDKIFFNEQQYNLF
jgi:hypothetical protein